MKKVFFALAIVGTLISAQTFAQGVLGKLKDKVKSSDGGGGSSSGGGDAATTTVTDEWGISGSYTLSSPWEISGKKQKNAIIEFVREENDVIVNRLELTVGKGGDKSKATKFSV